MNRRDFLAAAGVVAAAAAAPARSAAQAPPAARKARFRTGLVAYSYRQALQAKTMTYEDLIRIAVETGTDGIDMTVYWMPSTGDEYVLPLRRLAYMNRVEIYSIGTRVRLAQPTPELREKELGGRRAEARGHPCAGLWRIDPRGRHARSGHRPRGRDAETRRGVLRRTRHHPGRRRRRRDHRLRQRND